MPLIKMSYIIVHSLNKDASHSLYRLQKTNPDLFVFNLGNSKQHDTKVMPNNGIVLAYLSSLCLKFPNQILIWGAERVTYKDFPKDCIKGGKWMAKKSKRNLQFVPKAVGLTKEQLKAKHL